ncbi:MAG: Glutamate synthase [NADPH] small chain [Alphaproteobacteria bacterium MarineAlpha9_Bin4]|nr:MAG: Glutamate synthase [NADPH] small chain [Alphaproteobacteria bacterium MarineAlpha9_Bin4]
MAKITGFLEHDRRDRSYYSVKERIKGFKEFLVPLNSKELKTQASRCMDCGIPYCHSGCPVNNIIPDWNDMVYNNEFENALKTLHSTNNFPEFTGRICPAPCEAACTLNIDDKPVTIKTIECAIIDKGWKLGLVKPEKAKNLLLKSVAIIGSGPAGLAAAQQLARKGYKVTVYEKNKLIGGLLRYGIPDFKMEKNLIDRRVDQMKKEGVKFKTSAEIGSKIKMQELKKNYNAILISTGSEKARDLNIPGREASGIHFAMDFLPIQNKLVSGEIKKKEQQITAKNKHVVVIGGGDTGSDCIGTSIRQGAKSVKQIEIMPMPPKLENKQLTWPNWPLKLRTSSSQQEGVKRDWSVLTKSFEIKSNKVVALNCIKIDDNFNEIKNSNFKIKADLILLAMGFVHPLKKGPIDELKLKLDNRGNIEASIDNYMTSEKKVFAAGDSRRGQSLVVWAIREGREAAESIHEYLS